MTIDLPVAVLRSILDKEDRYQALMVWCPGCEDVRLDDGTRYGGLHMLPVTGDHEKRPTWEWNQNLIKVTLSPSILTKTTRDESEFICHSFLQEGMWKFLGDCSHSLANKTVPMLPLPEWAVR
jgi:uncharacterized protein DUF6527